jgi:hypothetical protein
MKFKVIAKYNNKATKRNVLPRKLRKKIIFATSGQRAIDEYEKHLLDAGFLVEPTPCYEADSGNFYYVVAKNLDEGYSSGYTAIITANET